MNHARISIHIDITLRGRDGYRSPRSQDELMPLRDEFTSMVREARRKTGRKLRAATALTVTADNRAGGERRPLNVREPRRS